MNSCFRKFSWTIQSVSKIFFKEMHNFQTSNNSIFKNSKQTQKAKKMHKYQGNIHFSCYLLQSSDCSGALKYLWQSLTSEVIFCPAFSMTSYLPLFFSGMSRTLRRPSDLESSHRTNMGSSFQRCIRSRIVFTFSWALPTCKKKKKAKTNFFK